MPTFKCKDIGFACQFQASAATEAELMKWIEDHAKATHGIKTMTPDLERNIKRAIKREAATNK